MMSIILLVFIGIFVILVIKSKATLTHHSHWNTLLGLQFSTQEYFDIIKKKLEDSGVEKIKFDTLNLREQVIGLSQRTYLTIRYQDFIFYVCGSPFGQHFFVSYWGHFKTTEAEVIVRAIPFIGNYLANKIFAITYYQYDQCSAFMTLLHTHITETIEEMTKKQGVPMPSLPKPVMSDVFKR